MYNLDLRTNSRSLVLSDKGNNSGWKFLYMDSQPHIATAFYLQTCACVGSLIYFLCDLLTFDLRKYTLLMICASTLDYLLDTKPTQPVHSPHF